MKIGYSVSIFFLLALLVSPAQSKITANNSPSLPPMVGIVLTAEQSLNNLDLVDAPTKIPIQNMPEIYRPESRAVFKLPYYLIPESMADYEETKSLSPEIKNQLIVHKDGVKYFKLFVHPLSEAHYKFLRGSTPYISAEISEFYASPTSSFRSLVTWAEGQRPFIAKVSLDRNIIGFDRLVSLAEVKRSMGVQRLIESYGKIIFEKLSVSFFPETAGLSLKESGLKRPRFVLPFLGAKIPEKLGGQIIREFPTEILEGKAAIFSLSSITSLNRQGEPLLIEVIRNSGLSASRFLEEEFIDRYMKIFSELSLERGLNFEPHGQNLTAKLVHKDGQWYWGKEFVLRDFGGFWLDLLAMVKSKGPWQLLVGLKNAATYKFQSGTGNASASYYYFYRRQVFVPILKLLVQKDPNFKPQAEELLNKLDLRFAEIIFSKSGIKVNKPDKNMTETQENLRMKLAANKFYSAEPGDIELSDRQRIEELLSRAQSDEQWSRLIEPQTNDRFISRGPLLLRVNYENKIVSFGLLGSASRTEFNSIKSCQHVLTVN